MRARAVLAAVVLGLALVSCSSADPGKVTAGATRADDTSTSSSSTTTEPADDARSDAPVVASFSQAITYDDGLKVQVTQRKQGKIGEYAAGGKAGGPMTVFTIKVTNGSTQTFDAALVSPQVTYGAEGDEADSVYDSGQGIGDGISGKILPGKAKSAKYAFAIPTKELGDVTMEVPLGDFEHDSAVFSGSVK